MPYSVLAVYYRLQTTTTATITAAAVVVLSQQSVVLLTVVYCNEYYIYETKAERIIVFTVIILVCRGALKVDVIICIVLYIYVFLVTVNGTRYLEKAPRVKTLGCMTCSGWFNVDRGWFVSSYITP